MGGGGDRLGSEAAGVRKKFPDHRESAEIERIVTTKEKEMNSKTLTAIALVLALAALPAARATETEHLGMQVLPAPGKVVIDGKFDDWDLTGGILACGDAENLHDKYSVWFHTMYDGENLYLLARWLSGDTSRISCLTGGG